MNYSEKKKSGLTPTEKDKLTQAASQNETEKSAAQNDGFRYDYDDSSDL